MSTFRTPPEPKLPGDIEPNSSPDSLRQGAGKSGLTSLDDLPPLSARFDKPSPSTPLSQRPSSPPPAMNSIARSPSAAATGTAISASRFSKGGIYQLTRTLEKKHGAFFISRLILASGINLRGFDSNTTDDPAVVVKFIKTLRNMLSPADMAGLMSQAPLLMNMK